MFLTYFLMVSSSYAEWFDAEDFENSSTSLGVQYTVQQKEAGVSVSHETELESLWWYKLDPLSRSVELVFQNLLLWSLWLILVSFCQSWPFIWL